MPKRTAGFTGILLATFALAQPQVASAQFVTSTSVSVTCLTGTIENCSYMGFLLESTPNMLVQSFQIIDGVANTLTFTLAGAAIYEGTNTSGTDVTSQFNLTLGASGLNANRFHATDPAPPYVFSPLYFVVHAATAGALTDMTYLMTLPQATNPSKAFTGNVVPTTAVPEPISMVLLGTGLLGIGVVRRRRREVESDT